MFFCRWPTPISFVWCKDLLSKKGSLKKVKLEKMRVTPTPEKALLRPF